MRTYKGEAARASGGTGNARGRLHGVGLIFTALGAGCFALVMVKEYRELIKTARGLLSELPPRRSLWRGAVCGGTPCGSGQRP
jgi:hypothetical protein